MEDKPQDQAPISDTHADEDGTVLVYGFVVIKDLDTGAVLLSMRA